MYNSQFSNLQEALQVQETKHRELTDLKEAFDGLTVETESSMNKLIGFEQALQSMTDEARKFEELSESMDHLLHLLLLTFLLLQLK
ncbi:hypothetical protein Sjap_022334 [Stephania japonica]|uniref:Uncharacterized protein n=1 Tax=Stephania japonica TaxID=461633 RepID=A0AAP0HTL5_9MAGN